MVEARKDKMSRRSFLKKSAVGAAGVAAVAAAPTILQMTENVVGGGLPAGDASAPLMAYVKDASQGTVVVMWGTKEFVAKDNALVSRLSTYTKG